MLIKTSGRSRNSDVHNRLQTVAAKVKGILDENKLKFSFIMIQCSDEDVIVNTDEDHDAVGQALEQGGARVVPSMKVGASPSSIVLDKTRIKLSKISKSKLG